MLIHLLMITGCRRGEIVGLKWDRVNWADSSIRIDTTLLYTPDRGVYESTTKTGADRTIKLPKETMELLRQYKVWQLETRLAMGDRWKDTPYVFTGECGGCMAPDTLSGYLTRFEKKYSLPHIHAHKFRHSMASVLYFSGADTAWTHSGEHHPEHLFPSDRTGGYPVGRAYSGRYFPRGKEAGMT